MSRPRVLSRHLATGGVLAGLALTGSAASLGGLVSLGALHADPVAASPGPASRTASRTLAHAVVAPSAVPAPGSRASRSAARPALRPTRVVTRVVPVGRTFSGNASWYGGSFQSRHTANGERFDTHRLTAASRSLPFGTRLRVCRHQRCVVVRVNDRGPYVGSRVLDLSRAARDRLGRFGVARVSVTPVERRRVAVALPVRRPAPLPARAAAAPRMVPAVRGTPPAPAQREPNALLAGGTLLAAGSALTWARRLRAPQDS